MAIIKTPGDYPKRIGNYVIYTSREQIILRTISGFTSKALKKSAKYKKCRQNASEFGRLSALCKTIRVALQPILPKTNNLALVNSCTKIMREVMTYDILSKKGMRTLEAGLATTEGKLRLQNYHFNPQIAYELPVVLTNEVTLETTAIVFPKQSQYMAACVYYLHCNWETKDHTLIAAEKVFYKKSEVPERISLPLPKETEGTGTVFTLLELEFYKQVKGNFIPMENDSSKVVMVLQVK